jgi:hypothetical protein
MMRILFLPILFFVYNISFAQTFEKEFGLFKIRVDKKGCWFVPLEKKLEVFLGKSEINFKKVIYLEEKYRDRNVRYGFNADHKLLIEDSSMNDFGYSECMDNTYYIEISNDRLLVSAPNIERWSSYYVRNFDNTIYKDSAGNFQLDSGWIKYSTFFLYDLKKGKVLFEDSLSWLRRKTEGGYFLRGYDTSGCKMCQYSLADKNGKLLFNKKSAREILSNKLLLQMVHPDAAEFYGITTDSINEKYEYRYMDRSGYSHLITFYQFLRNAYLQKQEFYFPDFYNSYIKNDTIFVADGEAKSLKYVAMISPRAFILYSDSASTDKSKDYIPFDTLKLFIMNFSDFYITNRPPKLTTDNNGEVIDVNYGGVKEYDAKDSSGFGIHFIDDEFTGYLNIYNKKLKKMLDFSNQFLLDFNYNYFLICKKSFEQANGKVKIKSEYFIYDKNLNLIKSTFNKEDFYKF